MLVQNIKGKIPNSAMRNKKPTHQRLSSRLTRGREPVYLGLACLAQFVTRNSIKIHMQADKDSKIILSDRKKN